MIPLKLNSFSDNEISDLINRLNVINPKTRCAARCEKCEIKHVCYAISRAVEYAQAYLDGRVENASREER